MTGPLALSLLILLAVLLPRIGGLVICCALVSAGCTAAADGNALSAAIWFAYGAFFGASPFYLHHRYDRRQRTTRT
jgi:hypothetical protein